MEANAREDAEQRDRDAAQQPVAPGPSARAVGDAWMYVFFALLLLLLISLA